MDKKCFNCQEELYFFCDLTIDNSTLRLCERCYISELKNYDGRYNKYFHKAPDMRTRLIKEEVEPFIIEVFEKYPQFNSVLMFVGQYYSDNAVDEVHKDFLMSTEVEPTTDDNKLREIFDNCHNNTIKDKYVWSLNILGLRDYNYEEHWYHDAPIAFASYCPEGGSQHDDNLMDSSSLYCVFKKQDDNNIITEVVKEQQRPYMEGLEREYERCKTFDIEN